MKTVLVLGAGRHQRAAILRAKELGFRVAAIDGNPNAVAQEDADLFEQVDFGDVQAAIEAARRIGPDGVLTITSDRAVPAVAAIAEALSPPGVGFAVGWIHLYPASLNGTGLAVAEELVLHSVEALGLRTGIAFPQLMAGTDGSVQVVEVAARIPGGQMADLVRHAVGVD